MFYVILAGALSGVIGGLGMGGGTVLIPVLMFFFGAPQRVAQGVNLVFFIPTAACALFVHIKNKSVEIKTALIIAGFGVLGAVGGFYAASALGNDWLRRSFGVLLLFMGLYEIFRKREENKKQGE